MRRRLAVILITDMVDYSAAMEADQSVAIGLVRELRERWLEPAALQRGGEVLKRMGDGWIIAFPSVADAVETAQAVQTALLAHDRIKLRIAAHLGEIVTDEADVYGTGINITARLQTEAPPGGVMISEDLHRQLDERLADGFSDAGVFHLKNLARTVTGYQWRPTITASEAPEELPVLAIEPVVAAPQSREALEAAADLREQLVHILSRRAGVRVIAPERSGKVDATYALRCRLRCRGDKGRITATLLRCRDGQATWSRAISGDSDDLFALSDRAADDFSGALRLQINAFDGDRLANVPDDQLSASELRSRAAMLFYRATVADYRHAAGLLARALILDPDNASGLAMWSEAQLYLLEACYQRPDPELRARILGTSDKAIQVSPRSDYSWFVRAHIRARLENDIDGARKDAERLGRLNPGYVLYWEVHGYIEFLAGNWADACRALTEAADRSRDDPFLPFRLYPLAIARMLSEQPEKARAAIAEATELRPSCRDFWLVKAWILRQSGKNAEAEKARDVADRAVARADVLAQNLRLPRAVHAAIGLPTGPIDG